MPRRCAEYNPARETYLQRVREVTERNVREGFLLPEDARRSIESAGEGLPSW